MKSKYLAIPYGIWIAIFVVFPLLLVVYFAFTNKAGEFTLQNFSLMWDYSNIFMRSFILALTATIICLLIGYPLAYVLSKQNPRHRSFYLTMIMLPMWMNFLLRTYAWMSILEKNGLLNKFLDIFNLPNINILNTPYAIVLGMVYNFLPFMALPIYNVLIKLDTKVIEASSDLGANAYITFKRIIFPLSMPGVISGITMVFVPAVSTFIISTMLGGGKYLMVGDLIEAQFVGAAYNPNLGSAISLVMMVLILVCMVVMDRIDPDNGGSII